MKDQLVAVKIVDNGDELQVYGFTPNQKNRRLVWFFEVAKEDRSSIPEKVKEEEAARKTKVGA